MNNGLPVRQPYHEGLKRLSGDLVAQLIALGLYGVVSLQGTSYSILNPATFRSAIGAAASSHSHPVSDLTGLGAGVAEALSLSVSGMGGLAATGQPTLTGMILAGKILPATTALYDIGSNSARMLGYFGATGDFSGDVSAALVTASSGLRTSGGSGVSIANSGSYNAGVRLQSFTTDGKLRVSNYGGTSGCYFDLATADTLTVRNLADSGGGNISCANATASGRYDGPLTTIFRCSGVAAASGAWQFQDINGNIRSNIDCVSGQFQSDQGVGGRTTSRAVIAGTNALDIVRNDLIRSRSANFGSYESSFYSPSAGVWNFGDGGANANGSISAGTLTTSGLVTSSGSAATRAVFNRPSAQNSNIQFSTLTTNAYVGIGPTNIFAIGLNTDLSGITPPFQFNLSTGSMAASSVGAVSSGDRYTIYHTDTTFSRSVGLYHSEDGTEGGLKATSQIKMKSGGKFIVSPSNQSTIYTERSIIGGEYIQTTVASALVINNTSNAIVPLKVRGVASQSTNLFECQTVTPTTVFSVSAAGNIATSGTLTVGSGTIFDSVSGQARQFNSLTARYQSNATLLQHVFTNQIGASLTGTVVEINCGSGSLPAGGKLLNLIGDVGALCQTTLSSGFTGFGIAMPTEKVDIVGNLKVSGTALVGSYVNAARYFTLAGGYYAFLTATNMYSPSDGIIQMRDSANALCQLQAGTITASSTIGFSQSRFQQSAAQTLQTQCFDTSLAAWQETTRSQASPTGAKWSVLGATPIVKQTLPAAGTDAATTQTLCNAIRSLLVNFGFSN